MTRCAIFDLDGTLVDSAADIHAAALATLRAEGLPDVSYDQSRGFVGRGARVFVDRLERAAAGENQPARTKRMHTVFMDEYERAHEHSRMYPGVEQALTLLKSQGWRLGLCTNKPKRPTQAVLAHFGWSDMFEAVIAGDTLPVSKPDPAPLIATWRLLGEGPVVFVGDSETDSATARAAELPFALYTEGYRKTPVDQLWHTRAFSDWADLPAIAQDLAV